jgi:hypothetical protein
MSMKHLFNILAALSLCLGVGLTNLSAAQAKPLVLVVNGEPPQLGSSLPRVNAGHHLVEAYYWRHRYYYHRWHRHRC